MERSLKLDFPDNRRCAATVLAALLGVCVNTMSSQVDRSGVAGAAGAIFVDVSESGRYSQFEVVPQVGRVRAIKERKLARGAPTEAPTEFQQPAGAIQDCDRAPEAVSPNGSYKARCIVVRKADGSVLDDELVLTENGSADSHPWHPLDSRTIDGFAWSADSRFIAVVSHSEHYSKSPASILSGLSGHPIPVSAVYLDVIDAQTGTDKSFLIRGKAKYVSARILRWSNRSSSPP